MSFKINIQNGIATINEKPHADVPHHSFKLEYAQYMTKLKSYPCQPNEYFVKLEEIDVEEGKDFVLEERSTKGYWNDFGYWIDGVKSTVAVPISPKNEPDKEDKVLCQNCKKGYSYDLIIPDDVWAKISPKAVEGFKGGGLLCPECIVVKILKKDNPASEEVDWDEVEILYTKWCSDNYNYPGQVTVKSFISWATEQNYKLIKTAV